MIGFRSILTNVAKYSSAAKPQPSKRISSEQFLSELERVEGKEESQEAFIVPKEKIELLFTEYGNLSNEVEDLNDKYRRSLAETENVRRRGQKQVEDAKVFAVQSFCKDLLEVADTLDLAIGAVKPENIQKNSEVKSLHDGVVMMKSVLLKTFEKHGLVAVSPDGEKFDPNLHEAVFQIPKDKASAKPGHIEQVMKIGYSLHGRPIRAAQVAVVQN
uniref:GrpE protein homolog n=1 Tax=Panagrolaimus superbus TaxID=310955 RepID=A0A914Z9M5_9BILA